MPETSITTARDAILSLFKTAWDAQGAPIPPVEYGDVRPFSDYDADDEWVWVSVQHNEGNQATLGGTGNRRFRREGVVRIEIFTPMGEGRTRADILAEEAVSAFEGQATALDGVWFRHVRIQEGGADPPWSRTDVLADFVYDRVV